MCSENVKGQATEIGLYVVIAAIYVVVRLFGKILILIPKVPKFK